VVGDEVGKSSYHLRWLWDCEFVGVVQERPVRGAIEFRYALASDNSLGVTVLARHSYSGDRPASEYGSQARRRDLTHVFARSREVDSDRAHGTWRELRQGGIPNAL